MIQDPLISAQALKALVNEPDTRVLDATWVPPFLKDRPNGKTCFAEGHIPGAQYFDIDDVADPDTALSHMLPSPDLFGAKLSALGIGNDSHVVIYDSNGFFASARAWWMLRVMGHSKVQVLDGGLEAWSGADGDVTTEIVSQIPIATFEAAFNPDLVRDMSAMQAHIAENDSKILDARDQGRFNGTSPEPRAGLPSGHMPGSYCVPTSVLLTPDKMMKTTADLLPVLEDFQNAPVVASCGSGVSAAVIALALARIGNWQAAVYDGSWSEWAAHPDNPIATAP